MKRIRKDFKYKERRKNIDSQGNKDKDKQSFYIVLEDGFDSDSDDHDEEVVMLQ